MAGSGSGSGQHGARGKAKYNHSTHQWEIVSLQVQAKLCSAQTTAAVYPGDATFTVNTVVPLDDGQSPVKDSSQTLTVANLPDWGCRNLDPFTGPGGTPCEITPDGNGGWRLGRPRIWPGCIMRRRRRQSAGILRPTRSRPPKSG